MASPVAPARTMPAVDPLAGSFADADAPLAGVRVLDLTRLIAGAVATRRLSDLGADVVKVEEPGRGDYARAIPPLASGEGVIHLVLNRGKRSVAADLKTPEGLETVAALARAADVVVEVSRPGRLGELGLDLDSLRADNPRVVVCHITGFGQDGPLSHLPSHGMNVDAYGGCLLADERGGQPHIVSKVALGVEIGGINAATAILAALLRAWRTGRGAELDVSCWDAAVDLQRYDVSLYTADGRTMTPAGDLGPLYDLYRTSDDRLLVFCAIEDKFWRNFCHGAGRLDLLTRRGAGEDVDFGDDDKALRSELEDIFAAGTLEEWMDRFLAWDVPGCPVLSTTDLVDHPHTSARQLLRQRGGEFPNLGDPVVWVGECRPGLDGRPAPAIGADTDEVLASWLGAR